MIYEKHFLDTQLVSAGCKYATLAPEHNPGNLPLLFLLHGGNGDRRFLETMRPLIEQAVTEELIEPLVVVTPSAGMSYYMDYLDGSEKWETLICCELSAQLENKLEIDASRQLVAGISMGGVGSLRLAFRQPEQFLAVAALEPGADPFLSLADKPAWYGLSEDNRLGAKFGTPIYEPFWRANNPASIATDNPDSLKRLKIYLEVGTHDGLFNHHNAEFLHRVLFDKTIKHEYRTFLGANHIGNSIPGRMTEALKFLGRALRPEPEDEAADQMSASIRQAYAAKGIEPPD